MADLTELETGRLHRFGDWPEVSVPRVAAGVYTVWRSGEYLYAGMSGRGASQSDLVVVLTDEGRVVDAKGLYTRLNSHASGRRSGDQFCIYVCDRFVVPKLTSEQQTAIKEGSLLLDEMNRTFIRTELEYRFVQTVDGNEAHRVEALARSGELKAGRPFLNPLGKSAAQVAELCDRSLSAVRKWLRTEYGTTGPGARRQGYTDEQVAAAVARFSSAPRRARRAGP